MARLRLVDKVEKEDVNEAMRLMEMSKDSLVTGRDDGTRMQQSVTDRIYALIREIASSEQKRTLRFADVKERCIDKGFKPDEIDAAIEEYETLNVFSINQTKTTITLM